MQDLGFYFDLGWDHIISKDALDHLLFVIVLSAVYLMADWKKVLDKKPEWQDVLEKWI